MLLFKIALKSSQLSFSIKNNHQQS